MLRDMQDIVRSFKKSSKETSDAMDPVFVLFGEVTSASPLKITVEQRLPLEANHFILTHAVRDHEVDMTVDSVRKKYTVHNNLVAGDKVKLLRIQGGQQYVIIDKE